MNARRTLLIRELQQELEELKLRVNQGEHYERLKIKDRLKTVQKQLNMHVGQYKRALKKRSPHLREEIDALL